MRKQNLILKLLLYHQLHKYERNQKSNLYKKEIWESSSAYKNRVNILINWASKHPERELSSIGVGTNTTTIFYCEMIKEENSTIIKGFSSK